MVSPANTYVGLTTNEPGSAPGEPQKYYPTGTRTYLRIVPIDSIQAASDLLAMKQAGCTKVADGQRQGGHTAPVSPRLLELEKGGYGINVVSNTGIDPTAPNFRSYASTIKGQGADCFFFAGISLQRRASRSPRTSTRRFRRPRSSAPTASARTPTRTPRRAACRRRSIR